MYYEYVLLYSRGFIATGYFQGLLGPGFYTDGTWK
jgi:hypothetical protein